MSTLAGIKVDSLRMTSLISERVQKTARTGSLFFNLLFHNFKIKYGQ